MRRAWILVLVAMAAACGREKPQGAPAAAGPARYELGTPATAAQLAAFDIDVRPDGAGLPRGRGTASQGATVFAQKCAVCHGAKGEGMGTFPRLIGRETGDSFNFGRDARLVKTVGNYWPYATTLYDYVHRAMPLTTPGSLQPDEVYSLVAFLLAKNNVIAPGDVIDAASLPGVRMPARDRFVKDDRTGGKQFR